MKILRTPPSHIELPSYFFHFISEQLKTLGTHYQDPLLFQSIQKLSDHFNQTQIKKTLWEDQNMQAAYLAYFLPLNMLRILSLQNEFSHLLQPQQEIIDFGSGPGTFYLALSCFQKTPIKHITCVETSSSAIQFHKAFIKQLQNKKNASSLSPLSWCEDINGVSLENKLGFFSYSLNELEKPPSWIFKLKTVIILEPSTNLLGRKLMSLRETLLQNGFHIYAPCTHQSSCPLLLHSKKDWCHQRVPIVMPEFWSLIEKNTPMKNDHISYSYLIASKLKKEASHSLQARVIGNTQKEKGKTKQAICRGAQREFLSWLKKNKNLRFLPRGSVIELSEPLSLKGDEIRL